MSRKQQLKSDTMLNTCNTVSQTKQ